MRLFICILAMISFVSTSAKAQEQTEANELVGTLQYFMPGDDDTYDSAFGVEGQIRFWQTDSVALALAGGIAQWEMNDVEAAVSDGIVAVGISAEGSALVVPIGASILFQPNLDANLSIVLECGVRYAFVQSDAEASFAAVDIYGRAVGGTDDIEIDNGILGVIAADVEMYISERTRLLFGLGYQFDISKGDAEWMGESLGENELKAFFLKAGFVLDL